MTPGEPHPDRTARRAQRPVAMRSVAVVLGVLLGALAAEALVRFALFHDALDGSGFARRTRQPARFARAFREDAFWALRARLGVLGSDAPPLPDPELGWLGNASIDPVTFAHGDLEDLRGRRPVALFGDSYAACTTPSADCFEGQLERTDLGSRYRLLNYGGGGYGFDQVLLATERFLATWPSFRPADGASPVIVVAIYVEDDLDRCLLSLRDWPKPRFTLESKGLALTPPVTPGVAGYLEQRGTGIRSYLTRLLLHDGPVPNRIRNRLTGRSAHQVQGRELAGALLSRVAQAIEEAGATGFFLLLPGQGQLPPHRDLGWQQGLLHATLESLGARFVDARLDFLAELERSGRDTLTYFGTEAGTAGHYNSEGNAIATRALVRGLAGDSDAGRAALDG